MSAIYSSVLYTHIAAGSISLLCGTINMIAKKGGKLHRKVGRLFVAFMMLTGLSALVMAQIKPNAFLFIIGVFTIYLVGTADRYSKPFKDKPLLIDWVYSLSMFVFADIFILWGIFALYQGNTMGTVMLIFGGVGLYSVYKDFINYREKKPEKKHRLLTHIGRMIDAYTATITAVFVVNAAALPTSIPPFVHWLLPTLILTPISFYWIRKRKK